MPGYGQEKLQTLVNYDNGEHITLAMNAMKQAQSLLQRPTTTEELTQTLTRLQKGINFRIIQT